MLLDDYTLSSPSVPPVQPLELDNTGSDDPPQVTAAAARARRARGRHHRPRDSEVMTSHYHHYHHTAREHDEKNAVAAFMASVFGGLARVPGN